MRFCPKSTFQDLLRVLLTWVRSLMLLRGKWKVSNATTSGSMPCWSQSPIRPFQTAQPLPVKKLDMLHFQAMRRAVAGENPGPGREWLQLSGEVQGRRGGHLQAGERNHRGQHRLSLGFQKSFSRELSLIVILRIVQVE